MFQSQLDKFMETIKYYLTILWRKSFLYKNIACPAIEFENMLKSCKTKEDAIRYSNIKIYKYLSNSYKRKVINDFFG